MNAIHFPDYNLFLVGEQARYDRDLKGDPLWVVTSFIGRNNPCNTFTELSQFTDEFDPFMF